MNELKEPKRWSEAGGGAPDELRQLLVSARQDVPDSSEMRALGLAAFVAGLEGGAVGVGAAAAGATGSGLASQGAGAAAGNAGSAVGTGSLLSATTLAKIGAGALLVGGLGTGIWVASHGGSQESLNDSPAIVNSAPSQLEAAPVEAPVQQEATVEKPDGELEEVDVAVEQHAPAPQQPIARSAEQGAVPAVKANQPSEVSLLRQAQHKLKSDPQGALRLANEHRRRFPNGQLSQEREVIRIEALKKLGRHGEASKAGERFQEQFPESAHQRKVDDHNP